MAQFHQHPVNIREGLPHYYVTDIDQDSSGFIWIATPEGLCRYDGSKLRCWHHSPVDPNSLSSNAIYDMVYDHPRGVLWIGTESGLDSFDVSSGSVGRVDIGGPAMPVRKVLLSSEGELWFTHDLHGVVRYTPNYGSRLYPLPDSAIVGDIERAKTFLTIIQDQSNPEVFWIGTRNGLFTLDARTGTMSLHRFIGEDRQTTIYFNQIRALLSHRSGTIFIGTWSQGLLRYIPKDLTVPQTLLPGSYDVLTTRGISTPILQLSPKLALVTSLAGNCFLELPTGKIGRCFQLLNDQIRQVDIVPEFIDHKGRAWASSEFGVFYFDPLHAQFDNWRFLPAENRHYFDGRLLELANRDLLITTYESSEGVYLWDQSDRSYSLLRPKNSSPTKPFNGEALVPLSNGLYIAVEREQLYEIDLDRQTLVPVDLSAEMTRFLWKSAIQHSDGTLWLGTAQSGVIRYNFETGTYERIESATGIFGGLPLSVDYLVEDRQGNVLMGTPNSYSVYHYKSDSVFHVNRLGGKTFQPTNFFSDKNGNIWFGISGQGVYSIAAEWDHFLPVMEVGSGQGLERLDLYSVLIDVNKIVWMITGEGLQSFNPETHQCRRYTNVDGLITFDPAFNRNPMVLTDMVNISSDRIAFVPRAGLTVFQPAALEHNTEIARPYILSVTAGDSLIYEPASDEIRIPHGLSPLNLSLSALGYTQSREIQFEYSVNGSNKWLEATNGEIIFNAPDPGEMTLSYRTINSDGLVSDTRSVIFQIVPPWWRSWWFYLLCIVLFGATAYRIITWRVQQKRRLQEHENQMRLMRSMLESKALRSQMNPHFLFNIFNTIQELILTGDNEMAYNYTTKFSKLLRMILEYSSRDNIPIEEECAFLRLYLELETLRFDGAFTYSLKSDPGIGHLRIPVFMVQPLVENAIRHGLLPMNGEKHVSVSFHLDEDQIICDVFDNGVGIDESNGAPAQEDRLHATAMIRQRLALLAPGSLDINNRTDSRGVHARLAFYQNGRYA